MHSRSRVRPCPLDRPLLISARQREREMWPLGEPPTDKELEVARILCDLEELILEDEFRRSNLSLVAGTSSWGTTKPRTLPPTLPSLPYNVPHPSPPTAYEGGGDGCGGPRSASPVTPLLFSGGNGDKDEAGPSAVATSGHSRHIVEDGAGSSAALPSLPGNRPEHNDGVATSGQGRHTVVDDVGPSVAPPSVLGNRSEHDDALATSRQETHTVDGDAGSSAPPPSVPRNRSENNDAGPRGAAPLPRGKQFKNPKRWCKEAAAAPAPAPAPDHHINLDLELRLCQPSPPALVRHPTLASVRPPEETSEALLWGWELQLQIQSEDRKEASRLARKRRMEIQREKKMQKKAKRSD
ncbi:uncharacterized protein LOC103984188 isoform X1 [Musa acuminata AAA Group]|uniref:uncharacterized protein LOC103984188 isoform X1 n=2 Tax=Musa acuminata AAA Group TaxID=214697 RepID=UPI0031DA023F